MKKILLAIVLVLAMAIPAFAQSGQFGPIKFKLLMVWSENAAVVSTPYFNVGETIRSRSYFEYKGTGRYRVILEVRNDKGVMIDRLKFGPFISDTPTFDTWHSNITLSPGVPAVAGYYTLKTIYVDVATGNRWSHQTNIHVLDSG